MEEGFTRRRFMAIVGIILGVPLLSKPARAYNPADCFARNDWNFSTAADHEQWSLRFQPDGMKLVGTAKLFVDAERAVCVYKVQRKDGESSLAIKVFYREQHWPKDLRATLTVGASNQEFAVQDAIDPEYPTDHSYNVTTAWPELLKAFDGAKESTASKYAYLTIYEGGQKIAEQRFDLASFAKRIVPEMTRGMDRIRDCPEDLKPGGNGGGLFP